MLDWSCAQYAAILRQRGYAESTVRRRVQLFEWTGGLGMTAETCRSVIDRPPTPETRRQYHSGVKRVIADLLELGWLDADPMHGWRLPAGSTYRPRPLSAEAVTELLEVPGRVGEWTTFGYFAALRRHEVCKVSTADLSRERRGWVVKVVGKGRRTETIPAHPRVVELLRSKPEGRLYAISSDHLTRTWNAVASALLGERVTFHQLRHSGITAFYEACGYDLVTTARFARHRRIQTTLTYAEVADTRLFEAVDRL